MVFTQPKWVPNVDLETVPDSIPVSYFMLDEKYGRAKLRDSRSPFICGLSGSQYTSSEAKQRVDFLARGLAKELNWAPNKGSEWDKVITIFAHNTLDSVPLSWAVHNLSGISSPANSAYNVSELKHQIKSSGSKTIFTCLSLLETAIKAATTSGIPRKHIYLLSMSYEKQLGYMLPSDIKTVDQLILEGSRLPELEPLQWEKGQAIRQCAFLMYSSGTTGLPKGVQVSHYNVMVNVLQVAAYESPARRPGQTKVVLGLLPQSHIYGIVSICHISIYRGDAVLVLPKFDLPVLAASIEKFKINVLFIVPPIIIQILNNKPFLDRFDLSSVSEVFSGAAPLGVETYRALLKNYPSWYICQGYGMTETTSAVSMTSALDIFPGSSGSLAPGVQARIVSLSDGSDISEYGKAGELLIRAPNVTSLGYLNNEKATVETFGSGKDAWLRTGDEAMFLKNPNGDGNEHLFIIDRIKELIKVNGHQVAPAELEACLISHPLIADAAVIPVPDDAAGEVPKAFVVLALHNRGQFFQNHSEFIEEIHDYVKQEKAHYKWLKGGIEFVKSIPKSPSGKILRRTLRDYERQKIRQSAARL
ncbi:AMP dependent ligase, putative [Talaromyces stipitatus ATCC 10500]|uniref:AMP dependent ligase, putative n=1 Tax=Talaromyces stipitatus (strain ATCC 10500 / CBS 375.48 / QM 6759 / NRRL 1006) TaxID=441959 RepID=B8MCM1_TALSN|nr:AMP dependent ligase, putative [Talaromyces stipitatus ATCC 10500]EED18837.1 AMP dependent ligase, putative [Talaromyces stipitatus ATCC 10500]